MSSSNSLIAHPHLLVRAISERFLPTWAAFRFGSANESHRLQPMLILTVHWWPAPICVGVAIHLVNNIPFIRVLFSVTLFSGNTKLVRNMHVIRTNKIHYYINVGFFMLSRFPPMKARGLSNLWPPNFQVVACVHE